MPKHHKKKKESSDNTPFLIGGAGLAAIMYLMYKKKDDTDDVLDEVPKDPKVAAVYDFARNFYRAFDVGSDGLSSPEFKTGLAAVKKGDLSWYKNPPKMLQDPSAQQALILLLEKIEPHHELVVTEREFVQRMLAGFGP